MTKLRTLPVFRVGMPLWRTVKAYSTKIRHYVVLCALLPVTLWAADPLQGLGDAELRNARWYQVELIVFAHSNPAASETEHWQTRQGLSLPDNTAFLKFPQDAFLSSATGSATLQPPVSSAQPGPPSASAAQTANGQIARPMLPPLPTAYEILPESDWQLTAVDKKLRSSRQFEPLLHVAWRQPTFERGQAIPVLLYNGMDIRPANVSSEAAASTNALINRTIPTDSPMRRATELDSQITAMNPRLVGTVELSVARYLHLKTDLYYRRMMPEQAIERVSDGMVWFDTPYNPLRPQQGPAYQMKSWHALRGIALQESRRMRSSEIHYLDHPLFGIVALITPFELPKPFIDDGEVKVLPPPASLNR